MPVFRLLRNDLGLDAVTNARARLLIGRGSANDVVINDAQIALSHCGIYREGETYWLTSFAPAVTTLNGEPIQHAALLPDDVIGLGTYGIRVSAKAEGLQLEISAALLEASSSTATARPAVTAERASALQAYWQTQRSALGLDRIATDNWLPAAFQDIETAVIPRRFKGSWLRVSLVVLALAGIAALVFPRAFSPGEISFAHRRKVAQGKPEFAAQPVSRECMSCHNLARNVQRNCAGCHTTASFQATVSVKHERLKLQCTNCHSEHRGAQQPYMQVANATCTTCHQLNAVAPARALHGQPVSYPVNAHGVWSWDGLSAVAWQQHQLPATPADYTLREQFHLLHDAGRSVGRTRCSDCHLAGENDSAQLKQNVRESCAQCHALRPMLATELAQLANRKQGTTQCISCHTQHGAAKDAPASLRRD